MSETTSKSRSDSRTDITSESGTSEKDQQKNKRKIIRSVNDAVSLKQILESHGISLNKSPNGWSQRIKCPFPFHKNGNENTPSFGYHFQTDRFNCFGCGSHGKAVEFVAFYTERPRLDVAYELLQQNNLEIKDVIDEDELLNLDDLLIDYANFVRETIMQNAKKFNEIQKVNYWVDAFISVKNSEINPKDLLYRINKAKELIKEIIEE